MEDIMAGKKVFKCGAKFEKKIEYDKPKKKAEPKKSFGYMKKKDNAKHDDSFSSGVPAEDKIKIVR